MGLLDFFKKGVEKPAAPTPTQVKPSPSGTPAPVNAAPVKPVVQNEVYIVKSGDSLSKISKQVYGDAKQWRRIFEANLDQIKDPNLIHPGQQLLIPRG